MLRRSAARHREAVIGKHLAGTGDMREHAIEHTSAMPVVVHAQLEKVTQKAPGLRNSEGERMLYFGRIVSSAAPKHRIGHSVAIGELIAQECDEVPGCGEAGADHRRPGRLVPEVINLVGSEMSIDRQQANGLPVYEFPAF